MCLNRPYIILPLVFLLGCALQRPTGERPTAEKYPSKRPPVYQEPLIEKDPFQEFAEKCRSKALRFEKAEELPRALFYWKVVLDLSPHDGEASERVRTLETRIREEAEKHFQNGLEAFHKISMQAARKEFLITLAYNPEHLPALDYLKHRLNAPDSITYEIRRGDTLRKISQEIYKDPGKDFLIAYFNGLNSQDQLKPGMVLKIPVIGSVWAAKPASSKEIRSKTDSLPKSRKGEVKLLEQADIHYAKGIGFFLVEEIDKAIEEWEETVRLNPDHPNAKKDLQKARRILENLRRIK